MNRRSFRLGLLLSAFLVAPLPPASADEKADAVGTLIPWLLDEKSTLKGILFADVIAATSGKRVLPVERADADEKRILTAIGTALDSVLAEMNAPESKTRTAKRVNEMSSHFENAIQAKLNASHGLACTFPKTAAGRTQRSGYPDLVLKDSATGRVFYLDPKLFAAGSKTSSFRTFYFGICISVYGCICKQVVFEYSVRDCYIATNKYGVIIIITISAE